MNITPETNIRLLKCPIKLDNKNQITFSSKQAQENYFKSLPYIEVDSSMYQRADDSIYYPDIYDNLLEYNYVMYQNTNYSDKWFYAFITDIQYENDNCTTLTIATDVFQTWQFDLEYKQSFVVREHTNDDTIGANVVDEGLDTGELIVSTAIDNVEGYNIAYEDAGGNTVYSSWIGVLCDYDPKDDKQYAGIFAITGSTFGSRLYLFPYEPSSVGSGMDYLSKFIAYVNKQRGADNIKQMFFIPDLAVDFTQLSYIDMGLQDDNFKYYRFNTGSMAARHVTGQNVPKPYGSYTDYTPKNNKCYCWPYSFLRVSNGIGNVQDYRWEDFSDTLPVFDNYLTICSGCSGLTIPRNYQGEYNNIDLAIPLAKYPSVSWSADAYTNWLTQNSVNRPVSFISSLIGTVTAAGSTAMSQSSGKAPQTAINNKQLALQGATSLSGWLASDIGGMDSARLAPNIAQTTNSGDCLWAGGGYGFYYKYIRVKTENLKMIDNYFTMFGYKTNLLKVPNITGRSNWNYVETRNCNILGNIPSMDLETIKQMFNSGITLWHTTEYFLDYSRTNSII